MPAKPIYRGRWITYLISIGLFVVMTAVVLLLVRGYSFDLGRGVVKTGLIVLDSSPKGAYVTVNGALRSERTRATLKFLPGTYNVKVDMPGVHPWQEDLSVEPGQAVLNESILLFKIKPGVADLASTPVPAAAVSPSGRAVAFLTPGTGATDLSLLQIGRPGSRTVSALAGYAAPSSFAWSPDGSRIITGAGAETRIITVADGRTVTLPVAGRAALAPGQSDAVIVESQPGRLSRAAAGNPPTVEPYENNVTAWAVTGSTVYVSHTDGSLVKRGTGSDRRVIAPGPALSDLNAAPESGRIYGRAADGTVYALTGDSLNAIITAADRYAVSRDGDQIVYVKQRELRLWDRVKQTDTLLTRFTNPPEQLGVVPGGHYVLYDHDGELHVIAADGRNDVELAGGTDLLEVADRENILVRNRTTGRTDVLTVLDR